MDKVTPISTNSEEQQQLQMLHEFQSLRSMVANYTNRQRIAYGLGQSYSGDRDLYKAFGYKRELSFADYLAIFERGDIGGRVIEACPDASWRLFPRIEEDKTETDSTVFEEELSILQRKVKLYHNLHRIDVLSGIGRFGVLFLGFNDGKEAEKPITPAESNELLYVRPYKEDLVRIVSIDDDIKSPRFGLPTMYGIRVDIAVTGEALSHKEILAHHTRVLHVAEGLVDNNVYGTPRIKRVFNRLSNLELIAGSSTEMWYRGAFPGYNFKLDADAQVTPEMKQSMNDQIKDWLHDFKRELRLQGVDVQSISPQVSDPTTSIEIQFQLLCAATGIPKRILLGSERGELASSQDEKNWLDKINFRRTDYCEPFVLRPFINRMMEVQVLPQVDEYSVEWPELIDSTEADKALALERKTNALTKYADSVGAMNVVPPKSYMDKFLGWEPEYVQQIITEVEAYMEEEQRQLDEERQLAKKERENRMQTPPVQPNSGDADE